MAATDTVRAIGDPAGMVTEWDVAIAMSDGVELKANVYRPADVGRVPVIVTMGPYGKDLPMSVTYPQVWTQLLKAQPEVLGESSGRYLVWEVPDPERWTLHGYAVVHIDARGTGRSPGAWSPFAPQESVDFAEAVEWLADQAWCTGKVGVLGVSFHAMAAWRVAERQPPHLAAIIPWYGAGDVYREALRHGGILSNTFIDAWWFQWVNNQHGSEHGRPSPFSGEGSTGPEVLETIELESMRENFPADARAHPLFDHWAAERAVDWSRVTVPFLSVGNWGTVGLHLRGNVEAFRHAASTEKWLMLLDSHGPGIDRFLNDHGFSTQLRFFDHYLKDVDNDWPSQPAVTYEVPEPGGARSTRTATTWPIDQTSWTRLHLNLLNRSMSVEPPENSPPLRYWPSSPGITFSSPPFEQPTEIVGPLALHLHASTVADDLDVFATVRVVDADGGIAGAAARGWLRLSQRDLDEQASTEWSPVHTHKRIGEVAPGEPYPLDVEIWPARLVVPPGGSLSLTIGGSDTFDTGEWRHTDSDDRANARFAGWATLYSDADAPSWLLLPVVA